MISWFLLLSFLSSCSAMEGIVTTVAGGGMPHIGSDYCVDGPKSLDGPTLVSRFNYPWGLVFDEEKDSIYVADCGCPDTPHSNDRIRRIDLRRDYVTTVAGAEQGFRDGRGTVANFFHSAGMTLDYKRQMLYVADSGNNAIRAMDLANYDVTTLSGNGDHTDCGYTDGPTAEARFCNPQQVYMEPKKSWIFVADTDNHAIRVIDLDNSNVVTITGGPKKEGFEDGNVADAKWRHPTGLAYDVHNDVLYVADHYNHAIRSLDFKTGNVKTLVGNGKPNDNGLNYPEGLALDSDLSVLYIVEFGNNKISTLSLKDNKLSTLAGGASYGTRDAVGADAQFYHPTCLSFDKREKILYVTDQYNHRIRAVTALGNNRKAEANKMRIEHFGKVDAYRDLLVHHRSSLFASGYILLVLLVALIAYVTRKQWITYIKAKLYSCQNDYKRV